MRLVALENSSQVRIPFASCYEIAHRSANRRSVAEGAIGGTADKVGGPFDKEGMIGKQFTTEGNLGGKVQKNMGGEKKA